VGNKIDLNEQRKVTSDEGAAFAEGHNMAFIETSAKENIKINEAFE
jgi:GTPase SAR1 family protein